MELIILILIGLWIAGYLVIPWLPVPKFALFYLKGKPITLWEVFIFLAIIWAIEHAPRPFREISIVLAILWVLSTLHIIALAGLANILVIAVIFGLILSLFE